MITLVYQGAQAFLFNDPPNWLKGYTIDFDAVWDEKLSLTKRATRRPYSVTPRLTVTFTVSSSGASLRTLQAMLRLTKTQQVLTPFWPAVSFVSGFAAMPIKGGILVAFKRDWSAYTIFSYGDAFPVGYAANDLVVPLLGGYIQPQSDFKFLNVNFAELKVTFTESSDADSSLILPLATVSAGPKPQGYTTAPNLLPFRPNHSDVTDSFNVDVTRKNFGFTRDMAATFYPHDPYAMQQARYLLKKASEVVNMIAWYYGYASQGASFWAAGALAVGYVAQDYIAGSTVFKLTDNQVQSGDYVCTFDSQGNILFAQIGDLSDLTDVSGDDIIGVDGDQINSVAGNLSLVWTVNLPKGQPIYALSLASLNQGKLTIDYQSTVIGVVAKMGWNEVRPETFLPADEVLGKSIGQLSKLGAFLHFWRDYGNGTIDDWYFTSFESDCWLDGKLYKGGSFSVGDITSTLNLEDDSCAFDCALTNRDGSLFSDNPVVQDAILNAEVPLNVSIFFADLVYSNLSDVSGDVIEGVNGDVIQAVNE